MDLGGESFEQFSTTEAVTELALPMPTERPRARVWFRDTVAVVSARPWVLSVVLLVVTAVLTSPWGDYPVNDDWQYARAAQLFAANGHVIIDTEVAPSLIGALFLAWPFIKVFGFSHVLLRALTTCLAAVALYALDELMRLGDVAKHLRARVLVLVAINPLFVNLAFSFMTEFYGFTPALLGAVIWFRSRRAQARGTGALIGTGAAVASGIVIGSTFWTRQYCILVYPAVVASTLLYVLKTGEWRRFWKSLPALTASGLAFMAVVGSYFWYASANGLLKKAFSGPLEDTLRFWVVDYEVIGGAYVLYMTAFLFPLLLTWPLSGRRVQRYVRACAVALGFALAFYALIQMRGSDDWGSLGVHRVFPYLSNIIHNAGIGPNTLTDGFFHRGDGYYVMSRRFWRGIGYAILGLSTLWGFTLVGLSSLREAPRLRRELAAFGFLFAVLSLAAVVQAYGASGFDRYALPFLFGVVLLVACVGTSDEESLARPPRLRDLFRKWSTVPFALACLPLAYFTVAGVHDYFRWNDARWALVKWAMNTGIPSTSIDGGYEVNGWLSYDVATLHKRRPDRRRCIGKCRCAVREDLSSLWNCYDESYRLGMSIRDGYVEVTRETPQFWFGQGQSIILSKRRR